MDGMNTYEPSVHTAFGNGIHEAIQTFVHKLYTDGTRAADEVDCIGIFESVFEEDLKGKCRVKKTDEDGKVILNENGKAEYEEVEKPVELTQSQKDEFLEHGHLIINYFTSLENRIKYFPNKKYEIVGIELPINMPVMNNLAFIGYLDIVLKDVTTGKIKIIDLKTSTRMWNKYQQNDMLKIMQLTCIKAFTVNNLSL